MSVRNIVERTLEGVHKHGAWWWTPLMCVVGYKNPVVSNRFYYFEPLCLDGWYDHITFGAPLRIYFGKDRRQWLTVRRGNDVMWESEPVPIEVSNHTKCPNCGEVDFKLVATGYICPTCTTRWI